MNEDVLRAFNILEGIGNQLGPWGALVAGGLDVIEGAINNAANNVDPTPEEVAKLVAKIQIPGETLIPKRPE